MRHEASTAIIAGVDSLLGALEPGVLGVFWPVRGEPDLRPAFSRWHDAGWTLALPVVSAADRPLSFARWAPGEPMRDDRFGIAVPQRMQPVQPAWLIVPCVGFDASGYRLGYGGGYYDRTLAAAGTLRAIGVAYDACELAGLDVLPHDRPLSAIVTQTRCLRFD